MSRTVALKLEDVVLSQQSLTIHLMIMSSGRRASDLNLKLPKKPCLLQRWYLELDVFWWKQKLFPAVCANNNMQIDFSILIYSIFYRQTLWKSYKNILMYFCTLNNIWRDVSNTQLCVQRYTHFSFLPCLFSSCQHIRRYLVMNSDLHICVWAYVCECVYEWDY